MYRPLALSFLVGLVGCSPHMKKGPVTTGRLEVTASGLPEGVDASITVTAPDGSIQQGQFSGTTEFDLPPGTYLISASEVGDFAPGVSAISAEVVVGEVEKVGFDYTAVRGSLTVQIAGGPSAAMVQIIGPADFATTLTATTTLEHLAPGRYTLQAPEVTVDDVVWGAFVSSQEVNVVAGANATASVQWSAIGGSLAIEISGAPVPVNIIVTGPTGKVHGMSSSAVLTKLPEGTYTVVANPADDGAYRYFPVITGAPATVVTGQRSTVKIQYAVAQGDLRISFATGSVALPAGSFGGVKGTRGFQLVLGNVEDGKPITTTVPEDDYTAITSPFTSGLFRYDVVAQPNPVHVARDQVTDLLVSTVALDGALDVSVAGLPAGASPSITISGPGGFQKPLTAAQTLSGLTPGSYTVVASPLSAGGFSWSASVTGSPAQVTAGSTAPVAIAYAATTGRLAFALASGCAPTLRINGPNAFAATTTAGPLEDLVPGSYIVTAADLVSAGMRTPVSITGSPATISAGATTTVSVSCGTPVPLFGEVQWVKLAGASPATVYPVGIAPLASGAVLAGNLFNSSTPTFGAGESKSTTLTGPGKLWLARFAGDGALVWAKQAGSGANGEWLADVRLLPSGDLLTTGDFVPSGPGPTVFGAGEPNATTLSTTSSVAMFLARFRSTDGSLVSASAVGGTKSGEGALGTGLAVYPDGSTTVCGDLYGTATFDPGGAHATTLTSASGGGLTLAHFDPTGVLAWVVLHDAADANSSVHALRCREDATGGLVVAGRYSGNVSLGGRTLPTPGTFFVARFDPSGKASWVFAFDANPDWYLVADNGLDVAADGSVTAAGHSTRLGGTGAPLSTGGRSFAVANNALFVVHLDASGAATWLAAVNAGAPPGTTPAGSVVRSGSEVLVSGTSYSTVFGTGEPGQTTFTAHDAAAFFAAFDASTGAFHWVRRAADGPSGAHLHLGASALAPLTDGTLLVAGSFSDSRAETAVFAPDGAAPVQKTSVFNDLFVTRWK